MINLILLSILQVYLNNDDHLILKGTAGVKLFRLTKLTIEVFNVKNFTATFKPQVGSEEVSEISSYF